MSWGVVFDAPLPVEPHDAVPTEVFRRAGTRDGLNVHVARRTAAGYSGHEVSRSWKDSDSSTCDLLGPMTARLTGPPPPPGGFLRPEFEARGFVMSAEDIVQ